MSPDLLDIAGDINQIHQTKSVEDNMRTVNMPEARTHLSRLVQAAGEPFIIARAGKPMVK